MFTCLRSFTEAMLASSVVSSYAANWRQPEMKYWCLSFAILTASSQNAFAAPPGSCVQSFVGTWMWEDGSGTDTLNKGGALTSTSFTAGKTMTYSWSCHGNSFEDNSPGHFIGQLSADGMSITGRFGSGTGTGALNRIGGHPLASA